RIGVTSAGVARVSVVLDHGRLAAGDLHLLGVEDDDEIAGIHVRGVRRLMFTLEDERDPGRESAENLPAGVDDVPVSGNLARLGHVRTHVQFLSSLTSSHCDCVTENHGRAKVPGRGESSILVLSKRKSSRGGGGRGTPMLAKNSC